MTNLRELADIDAIRNLSNGFAGRFFYDTERGDLAYIARECDERTCDCERKPNNDGDQDCSVPIAGWGGVDEAVGVPIAAMLNSFPALLEECDRLRAECHGRRFDPNLVEANKYLHDQAATLRSLLREAIGIAEDIATNGLCAGTLRPQRDRLTAIKREGGVE